ncbi:MAG: LysM peptidoglycan-binding domain-containing protein [Proteobacteria bacterium]|nr:LysM peptidoglycan-binding domain-containing protein [Pseudomonadota bacterium]
MIINGLTYFRHQHRLVISLLLSVTLGACSTLQPDARAQDEGIPGQANSPELAVQRPVDTQAQAYVSAPPPYVKLSLEKPVHVAVESEVTVVAFSSFVSFLHKPSAVDIQYRALVPNLAKNLSQSSEAFVTLQQEAIETQAIQTNAWYRLQKGMSLPETDNKRIKAQLNWYLKHRGYLARVMQRAGPILPFILDELEQRNMPTELALLPVVESAYQAFAYSHGRASGLWQIIPSTGRNLGLKQNWWYDGRRDIIESTQAAIRYLDGLAREFNGDWDLALASYNAGPGRIRSAIRYNKKKNRPTDFWSLTRLRKETKDYVPKLYALKQIFDNPEKYGLEVLPVSNELSYQIVELDGQIDLALAADLAGISINQIYQLNPAFNRWATPPDGPHRLLLPKDKSEAFSSALLKVPAEKRINWVRHKIKTGETLSQISRRYRTTTALIKKVNKIRGTQIRAGKYLTIPTATKSISSYKLSAGARKSKIQNTRRSGDKHVHIVRSGQSLWSISRSYGVSTSSLARWNGIAPIDTLRVGQKLVIWTKKAAEVRTVSFIDTGPGQNLHALRYTVRKGDSLSRIADRFNIRVSDIKRWNRLGKYLQPGQKIKLYVDITRQSG